MAFLPFSRGLVSGKLRRALPVRRDRDRPIREQCHPERHNHQVCAEQNQNEVVCAAVDSRGSVGLLNEEYVLRIDTTRSLEGQSTNFEVVSISKGSLKTYILKTFVYFDCERKIPKCAFVFEAHLR